MAIPKPASDDDQPAGSLPAAAPLVLFTDDATLVARVRAGDRATFEVIFTTTAASLYRYAHSIVRSRALAQELVHDVFVQVWVARESWVVRSTIAAYLHGAVRNRALNHLRRQARETAWERGRMLDLAVESSGQPEAADAAVHCEELLEAVKRAIPRLPARCREVYVLHRKHNLSYVEIAAVLDLSPKTVENHLARALKALRGMLAAHLAITLLVGSIR